MAIDVFDRLKKDDIFDRLSVERKMFAKDIFDRIKKEVLTEDDVKVLIERAVENFPKPEPKVVERIVEKPQIIEKTEIRQAEVDLNKIRESMMEEFRKELDSRLSKMKPSSDGKVYYIAPMLPNYSGENGSRLTAKGGQMSWDPDVSLQESRAFYFGDKTTEGSWRLIRNDVNLSVQRLESGSWVEKGSFLA